MKKTQFASLLIATTLVAGCSSLGPGRTIVTGTRHNPIQPEHVRIYNSPPTQSYEVVASIMAEANGTSQGATDKAVLRLKRRAAAVGANGVILTHTATHKSQLTYYGIPVAKFGAETGLGGAAIYVQP